MEENLIDLRISKENKIEFNTRGWTLVDLRLKDDLIKNAASGLRMMKYNSIKNDFRPRRIYYDHLITNNLAAIELPFNRQICNDRVKNFFKEAKIGSLVKTLMGWNNPCCDLARLFCMGKYNYRGNWHRDYSEDLEKIQLNSEIRKVVLVGIYLIPQSGFRILKKNYEFNGKSSIVRNKKIDNLIRTFPFPLSPPENAYNCIEGKIGTALFFDPFLLHQGSNFGERLDFHMKFCNSYEKNDKKNNFQDFSVINILHEDYNFSSDNSRRMKDKALSKIPFTRRSSIFERFYNSIDYRIFLKRILKTSILTKNESYNILKKQGWKIDFFSNTFMQK